MKKEFWVLLLMGGWMQAQGQPLYFWTAEGKVSLEENRNSAVVYVAGRATADEVFASTRAATARVHAPLVQNQHFIVSFTGDSEQPAALRVRGMLRSSSSVRSIAYSLRIAGGMTVWPTHRIIYQSGPGYDQRRFDALLAAYPGARTYETPAGTQMIEVPELDWSFALANDLHESGLVAWAQPDFIAPVIKQGTRGVQNTQCQPSDALYSPTLFYLNNNGGNYNSVYPYINLVSDIDIDAPEAWCITKGHPNRVVAIIDEGVEDHEDLYVDSTGVSRVLPGYMTSDPLNGTGAPMRNGDAHGIAVAGIIAASHNSLGVSGIAPNVRLLPVHVFTDDTLWVVSDFADAIQWAWQNGADVINNSWVFDTCATTLFASVEQALADATTLGRGGLGCVVTFSTGSDLVGRCVGYPATRPEVLAVGAITGRGQRPNYASFGSTMDVVGVSSSQGLPNITVIDRMDTLGYNSGSEIYEEYSDGNYTKWFGGTSVSCAQASGIAALVLSVDSTLTQTQVRNLITSTAIDMGSPGFDNTYGHGRLNAYEAVNAALPVTFPVEWLALEGRAVGSAVEITWTTAREVNNDYFVVERFDGRDFVVLGEVVGSGTTDQPTSYRYVDTSPTPGVQVYRLRQVDYDGHFAYSSLIQVALTDGLVCSNPAPNPADAYTEVQLACGLDRQVAWQVVDLQGRILQRGQLVVETTTTSLRIATGALPAGYYLIQLDSDEQRRALPLLVSH
ncbi:MAG: hypothetical protein OHK0039_01020 [Bacteroidia bacterium]